LILRHYVEMLRRNNIVQDEKLIAQAKRLYEKHKEAFDFVSQYQTRGSNLLDQVRALIESQRALVEDKHISTILRFIPTAWENIPELHSCPASEWTKTGRSVLFEVKANEDKRIIVALVLGPSNDPQLRQRIYSSAAKKPELFRGIVKPMG